MRNYLRLLAALAAALLLLAACSAESSDDDASSDDSATPEATEETPEDAAEESAEPTDDGTTASDGAAGDGAGAPFITEGSGPGVSDETVKMAFIYTDLERTANALDFEVPDFGDYEAQIAALAEWVNANGGIGGRDLEPVVRVFEALQDTPSTEEELCNGITQDDQVFAVVLTGQFQENARPCYAGADTLMLDTTLFPIDSVGFDELSPYLWQPTLPDYADTVAGLATTLVTSDFLAEGTTLGVVGIDSELNQRVYEESLIPTLDDLGAEVADTQWIDGTDSSTLQATQEQAILSFKSAGVDRVVTLGGSRLASFLITIAETQNYFPTFAMTSFDSPSFNIENKPEYMVGSVGVSVQPGWDVEDDQLPFPAAGPETECLEVMTSTGETFETRGNARIGLLYCDAIRILKAGADLVHDAPLTAATWTEAVDGLGDSVQLASAYGTEFGPGRHAGGAAYRSFAFDEGCQCMVLTSEATPFNG